jgi:AcrR family transcriptional regulator
MARTLNREAHAVRRDCFVDAATRLIQTRGYEQLSIQDVLDETDSSKGAFYHYFDSKEALLQAVIARMMDAAIAAMMPIVADPDRSAADKLNGFFSGIAQWKAGRRDLMVRMIEVWISDDNAVVRERYRRAATARLLPLLALIVRQGISEGTFSATSPDHTAGVLTSLLLGSQESASRLFVACQAGEVSIEEVERAFDAFGEAYQRILGAPAGSIGMVDDAMVRFWFEPEGTGKERG